MGSDNGSKFINKDVKRIRNKISAITATNIYNTMIKPHLEFGSTIVYTCCNETQMERLQKLQNKGMRSILKCNIYIPIEKNAECAEMDELKRSLQMNTLQFIQKMKTGDGPKYLTVQLR